jgi:O-antigen ligase
MDLLAALFFLAVVVWTIPLIKDGRLARAIPLLLITGTVFGPPFYAFNGPIQISADRLLWAALIGLACVQWRLGKTEFGFWTRIDLLMVALVGYLLLRTPGGDPEATGIDPKARWLFYIVMPAGTYFIARVARINREDFKWYLWSMVGLGLYLSFTAVCEIKGLTAFVFPKFILDPDVWEFLGRGRGPLLNPAGNGLVIGVATAAAASLFVGATRRVKLFLAMVLIVLLVGSYATLTRSCWLGYAASVAAIGFVFSPRPLRVLAIAAAILLAVGFAFGLKDQLLAIKRDKDLSAAAAAKSVELRPLLAVVAWEMFKDKPVSGHGLGQYLTSSEPYHSIRSHGMPLEQVRGYQHHNVFLGFLVDTGLIGFGIYFAILATLASYSLRLSLDAAGSIDRRRAGLFFLAVLAGYLPNAMFHDMTIIPMVQMFLLGSAGVLVAIYEKGFAIETNVDRRGAASATSKRQAMVPMPS